MLNLNAPHVWSTLAFFQGKLDLRDQCNDLFDQTVVCFSIDGA
jgi:hypothetical protein